MAIGSLLLAGVLTMGPHWNVMDLPYPDVDAPTAIGGAAVPAETQIADSIAAWVRKNAPGKKHEVTQLRILGGKASAQVNLPDKTWLIHLERKPEGWKVVER
jgi:hypothetical protein